MSAVIPMGPPNVDVEERARERAHALSTRFAQRLEQRQKEDPDAQEYAIPLPWFAHEDSRELQLVVEHFRPLWASFVVRRGSDCLYLVFLK